MSEQRALIAQQMLQRARLVLKGLERKNEESGQALIALDKELRQFFDSLSPQEPVTASELTILEDVGALLNRAKTLAAAQRTQVLDELKQLSTSRSGIEAYRLANATH